VFYRIREIDASSWIQVYSIFPLTVCLGPLA
jgi:hypothetical protein